jgi:excisionase family DNA binding protein
MQHASDLSILVTMPEAARLLAVSTRTIQNFVRLGKLRPVKIGGRGVRFRRADLERFASGDESTNGNTRKGDGPGR